MPGPARGHQGRAAPRTPRVAPLLSAPMSDATDPADRRASVAWPDVDGMRNASGRLIRNITIAKTPELALDAVFSIACSTVSVICVLFMITVTPRASTITSAG